MKKYISLILMLILVFSVSAYGFSDVNSDYQWAKAAIDYFYEENIINGYEDGSFRPGNYIKNSEVAKILVEVFGEADITGSFSDVSSECWYATYVNKAYEYFLRDDKFYPEELSKRKEIAYAIYTAIIKENFNENASEAEKYEIALSKMQSLGIIEGYEDNTIRPENNVTRAEFCVMLKRALDIKVDEPLPDPQEEKPQENEKITSLNYFFVVTHLAKELDEKGEVVDKISGYNNSEYEEIYIDDNALRNHSPYGTSEIKENDILYVFKDYFGTVKGVSNICNADNIPDLIDVCQINAKNSYIYGVVLRNHKNKNLNIKGKFNLSDVERIYRISENANFYIYKNGVIKTGDIEDIEDATYDGAGDYVFCHIYDDIIEDVLIIK